MRHDYRGRTQGNETEIVWTTARLAQISLADRSRRGNRAR